LSDAALRCLLNELTTRNPLATGLLQRATSRHRPTKDFGETVDLFNSIKTKFTEMRQRSANAAEFKGALLAAAADGTISEEETKTLQSQYAALGITLDDLARIRVQVYTHALQSAKTDGQITAEEEQDLHRIQSFLKIPDHEIKASKTELARLRLLAELQAGNPPIIHSSNVILQKGEDLHWLEPAALLEERVVGRRYVGGSSGVSIRIMKGVSYRVGQSRGRMVADSQTLEVSHGDLVLTSRRVMFRGDRKSFNYRVDNLLDVQVFQGGVRITGDKGAPHILRFQSSANCEVVASILSIVVNKLHE
jgi:tellurite resistance protein